jgi:dTDP-4-dehydrorhamnose reductase
MTRWLVAGAGGMLGRDLVAALSIAGDDVAGLTRSELDIRDATACRAAVSGFDVVVNAAAWTDVDGAEGNEAEAFAVNATGAANLARASASVGAVLVQFSTDYVFAGDARTPYPVDAALSPVNAYGRTKAAAEWAVRAECPSSYVVRTAWLYGEHGRNFVATMLARAARGDTMEVVDDQHGQPTWTRDLAEFVRALVVGERSFGIYHGTATGETTWFGLASEAIRLAGFDPSAVRATTSDRFPRPAARPSYSVLANGGQMPPWQDGLRRALPGLVATAKLGQ